MKVSNRTILQLSYRLNDHDGEEILLFCLVKGGGRVIEGGPSGQGGVTLGKRMNSGSRLVYQILHTYLYPYLTP